MVRTRTKRTVRRFGELNAALWLLVQSSLNRAALHARIHHFVTGVCVCMCASCSSHRNAPRWFSGNPTTTTTCWFATTNPHSNALSYYYRSHSFRVCCPAIRRDPSSCHMQFAGAGALVVRSLRQTQEGEAPRQPASPHTTKQCHRQPEQAATTPSQAHLQNGRYHLKHFRFSTLQSSFLFITDCTWCAAYEKILLAEFLQVQQKSLQETEKTICK